MALLRCDWRVALHSVDFWSHRCDDVPAWNDAGKGAGANIEGQLHVLYIITALR